MPISILIADSELLYAAGAAEVLKKQPDVELAPIVRDQPSMLEDLSRTRPVVALVAHSLITDASALAQAVEAGNSHIVLLLDADDEPTTAELRLAKGILRKSADAAHLVACVRSIAGAHGWNMLAMGQPSAAPTAGERVLAQLSPRQISVMAGVARGAKNAEIARALHTSEQVVKNMLRGIYDLTGVSDRLELALFVLHQPELAAAVNAAHPQADQIPSG